MILSPIPVLRFYSNIGLPLVGGKLFTYVAGTTTKIATYTDSTGGTPNTNPIILNFRGEANVWLDPTLTYKFVLAGPLDTDPPTNPIWSVDNISALGGLTQDIIGQIIYPRTAAEIAAAVFPIHYINPPGSVLRYGADPTGGLDSSTAWTNAIKANAFVFDDYPGGGSYLFNTEVAVQRFPVRITGQVADPVSTGGSRITLASAAGAGKAAFNTGAARPGIVFEYLKVGFQTTLTGQIGFRFGSDARNCSMFKCAVIGAQAVASTAVGVQFDGTGTYSAFNELQQCYFSGLKYGVDLQGTCTVIDLIDNSFIGYGTSDPSYALKCSNLSSYNIEGGHIEGYNTANGRGIFSQGAFMRQERIRYEVCTAEWEWVRTAPNARIWGMAWGEPFISGGAPIYPAQNDVDACMVLTGPGTCTIDNTTLSVRRGYFAFGRSARESEFVTDTFSGANFQCNNGGTWTVDSGDQATFQYNRDCTAMQVNLDLVSTSTSVASPTQLIVTMPQSRVAVKKCTVAAIIVISGTREVGYATIAAGSGLLAISRINGAGFGTVANAIDVALQITIEIT